MNEPDNTCIGDFGPTLNAYEDEQVKLDDMTEEVGELWLQISALLQEKGYKMRPILVNGLPDVVLSKL